MDAKTYLMQAETWRLAASACEALVVELGEFVDFAADAQAAKKLVWAKSVLSKLMAEHKRSCAQIESEIACLDWPVGSRVLYLRYVQELSLGEIASTMHYSYSYIRKLHTRALRAFEKQFMQSQ